MKNNFFVPFLFDHEAHWKIRMTSMNAMLLVFQFIMCVKGHRSTLMPDFGELVIQILIFIKSQALTPLDCTNCDFEAIHTIQTLKSTQIHGLILTPIKIRSGLSQNAIQPAVRTL